MERLDYYLVTSRAACTALGAASFAIGPQLGRNTLVAEAFVAVKVSAFWAMLMSPMLLLFHVAVLRQWQWFEAAPGDHFAYPVVFLEWVFATGYWGSGTAALGILIDHSFRHTCVGEYHAVCRRYDVAVALVLLLGVVTAANAVVLHVARVRSNGPRLLQILFGH